MNENAHNKKIIYYLENCIQKILFTWNFEQKNLKDQEIVLQNLSRHSVDTLEADRHTAIERLLYILLSRRS